MAAARPARGRTRHATLMLCLAFGLGNAGMTSQAVWVASAIHARVLPTYSIGLVASIELLLLALSTLVVGRIANRISPKPAIVGASLAAALANVLAMAPLAGAFVAGRLASGVAMGVLLAMVTTASARRPDAQRILTFMQGSVLIIAVAIFATSPYVAADGPGGVFAVLAGLAGVTAAVAMLAPRTDATPPPVEPAQQRSGLPALNLAPLAACAGLASIAAGAAMIGTFFLVIADGLGFGRAATAQLLAAIFPLSLAGPVISHFLGERLGLVMPIVLGMAAMVLAIFFLVRAPDLVAFGTALAALCSLVMFYPPYAIALIGRLDSSGQWASAAVAFMMIGGAFGPGLGSGFVQSKDYAAMATTAIVLVIVGAGILITAAAAGRSRT